MIKRVFLITASLFCLSWLLVAKEAEIKGIPKVCKVHKPAYSRELLNLDLLNSFVLRGYEMPEKTNQYWDVYSDRSQNVTYTTHSAATPYSELGFKEKVRIASIRKGFALVYKTNDESAEFPEIPADAEWKGWVPMRNLVFMEKVLVNNVCIPISVLINDNIDFDSQPKLNAKLFFNPADEMRSKPLPNCSNSVFYVIKKEGSFVLLATETDISSPSSIYGWMSWTDVMEWDSRVAVEPTWDIVDNEFFAQSAHLTIINGLDESPIGRIDYGREKEGGKFSEEYYRLNYGAWRFPVLYSDDSISMCAIPGQSSYLYNPSQRVPVLTEKSSWSGATDGETKALGTDINIMFIIDGSRLYEPFFPILAKHISLMGNRNGPSNIKVGALIYHDARSGQHMAELHELTDPSSLSLYDFVDMGGEYGFKDNLSEAPVFAALDEAVSSAGFDPLAQNFVVLIGGRGDSSDSPLFPSVMAKKLASLNIGVYALQVQNNSRTAAYRLFGYLMEDILRQSVEYKYKAFVPAQFETDADYTSISFYKDDNNRAEVFDGFRSINNGLMSEEDFEDNLDAIIQRINESVAYSVGRSAALASMYPQFFRAGIAENVFEGRKLFKSVALFSIEDFDHLLNMFARLNEMYLLTSTDREKFLLILEDNLPAFIKLEEDNSYYPYDKKNNKSALTTAIRKMGLYQVLSLIEGIEKNDSFKGPLVGNIVSPKDVSDQEFLFLLSELSRRYYRLLSIRNNPARFSTYINNRPYFWLPCDDLL